MALFSGSIDRCKRLQRISQYGRVAVIALQNQSEEQATQARREQQEEDAKKGAEQRQRDKKSQEALDRIGIFELELGD